MRGLRVLAIVSTAFLAWPGGGQAADDLYEGRAIVTGQMPENRPPGFAQALEDVLAKVSGDLRLIGDPRVAGLKARAALLVEHFRYRDRMGGIPTHDEQGARDRPYDLIVRFQPAAIDAALRSLGRAPWLGSRPRVAAFVAMRKAAKTYVVAADGDRDLERESFAEAARRRGMPAALAPQAALALSGFSFDGLMHTDLTALEAAARSLDGALALAGRMDWREAELAWLSEWRLVWQGRSYAWRAMTETYDGGFRAGLGGAAQILSGHGAPE